MGTKHGYFTKAVAAGLFLGMAISTQAAMVEFTSAAQGIPGGIMTSPWTPSVGTLGVTITANSSDQATANPYLNGTGLGVYVDGLGDGLDQTRIRGDIDTGAWQELVFAFDTAVSFADLIVGLYFVDINGATGSGDDPVFFYSVDGGNEWTEIGEAALYSAWTQVGDTVNPDKKGNKFEGYVSFSALTGSGDITHLVTRSAKGGFQVSDLKTTSVPDGGMTAMLLGLALLGLGGIARKMRG